MKSTWLAGALLVHAVFLQVTAGAALPHSGVSAEGTASGTAESGGGRWQEGLTDRELAISRWFSHLTFLQDRTAATWPHWHQEGKQLGVTSLRYQLAFAGYGCAAMAAKTPAYRDLVQRQLYDLCERMIDRRVWDFVTFYWQYGDGPPDPCLYENVMYTGHLTQLMCLYQLMTGDARYSDDGWDFVWHDGRPVPYDLRLAIRRLHVQTERNRCGGIACEPGLVFSACNSHSAASFVLYDTLYGTRYAETNPKWFDWLSRRFRIPGEDAGQFFYVVYHQPTGIFAPVGDTGSDCWTLGWGYPWFPSTDLARAGWKLLLDKAPWNQSDAEMIHSPSSPLIGCCGGGYQPIRNSFIPLLGVQVEGRHSQTSQQVLRWLDTHYGRQADLDGDGHAESYYYSDDGLRIATTGNIATALATDGDSLRRLFRTPRRQHLAEPTLARVDYPNVYVRTAEYLAPVLRFTVLKGTPGFQGPTEIVCTQLTGPVTVRRNGQPFSDWSQTDGTLVIRTDVDREHVFEVIAEERLPTTSSD
jgi:hypothetical protein